MAIRVCPVCILGVNINKGQEISLRLRTDDLRGFRRYDRIRETLVHELAHMVFSEHDNSFKELNSQLLREAAAHDWTRSARALAGEAASFHDDWEASAEAASKPASHKLGGGVPAARDAQAAAAQAALERAQAASASASVPEQQAVPEPEAVDLSWGAEDSQRESIEGMGHHDDTTEKLEEEMRKLGTPTVGHGKSGPFAQDHSVLSDSSSVPNDAQPGSSNGREHDQHDTGQSRADASDDSLPEAVAQAVQGVVSAAAPADARTALGNVMRIIKVKAISRIHYRLRLLTVISQTALSADCKHSEPPRRLLQLSMS